MAGADLVCIDGLEHGEHCEVVILEGLPAADTVLAQDLTFNVSVPNRSPVVEFPSGRCVLPAVGSAGIPVETINVETLALNIYRMNDRALVQELQGGMVFETPYNWSMNQLENTAGELV